MKLTELTQSYNFKSEPEWRTLPRPDLEGVEFFVAPNGNKKQKERFRRLTDDCNKLNRNNVSEDLNTEMYIKCIPGTILLDWRGIENEDGTALVFSEEKALELLTNIELFCEDIMTVSVDISHEKAEAISAGDDNAEK